MMMDRLASDVGMGFYLFSIFMGLETGGLGSGFADHSEVGTIPTLSESYQYMYGMVL